MELKRAAGNVIPPEGRVVHIVLLSIIEIRFEGK